MCDLRKQIVQWISFTSVICNLVLLGLTWHLYKNIDGAWDSSMIGSHVEVASEILDDWVKTPFVDI